MASYKNRILEALFDNFVFLVDFNILLLVHLLKYFTLGSVQTVEN